MPRCEAGVVRIASHKFGFGRPSLVKRVTPKSQNPPSKQEGWGWKVLSSIVGMIATFAVGDLVLKRNYENYIKEKNDLIEEIRIADREFSEVESDVSNLIRERRAASQRLNVLSSRNNIGGFLEFYDFYKITIADWNKNAPVLEKKIKHMTNCGKNADYFFDKSKFVAKSHQEINYGETKSLREYLILTNIKLIQLKGCPAFSFFQRRNVDDIMKGSDFISLSEVFYFIHEKFSDSVNRNVVTCFKNSQKIINQKIDECSIAHNSNDLGDCLSNISTNFSIGKICSKEKFEQLAKIELKKFDNIDKFWAAGLNSLKEYRTKYVLSKCSAKKGFWANYLDWDCKRLIAN
jgi:hypothetical protein